MQEPGEYTGAARHVEHPARGQGRELPAQRLGLLLEGRSLDLVLEPAAAPTPVVLAGLQPIVAYATLVIPLHAPGRIPSAIPR